VRQQAAIDEINGSKCVLITGRQVNTATNIVEEDHGAIKRLTRPMLNFKLI
jgi:putative transposase